LKVFCIEDRQRSTPTRLETFNRVSGWPRALEASIKKHATFVARLRAIARAEARLLDGHPHASRLEIRQTPPAAGPRIARRIRYRADCRALREPSMRDGQIVHQKLAVELHRQGRTPVC
jgi:hypothetical protein